MPQRRITSAKHCIAILDNAGEEEPVRATGRNDNLCGASSCLTVKVWKWKFESESVNVKVWKWKCECESVKVKVRPTGRNDNLCSACSCLTVKVWKRKFESESVNVKVWKWDPRDGTITFAVQHLLIEPARSHCAAKDWSRMWFFNFDFIWSKLQFINFEFSRF